MGLFSRCKHVWTETSQTFTPPKHVKELWGNVDCPEYHDIIYGYTIISMVCDLCHKPKTVKTTGEFKSLKRHTSEPMQQPVVDVDEVPALENTRLWRVGHRVGRTIYMQLGAEPSANDVLIGVMDSPEIAEEAIKWHNTRRRFEMTGNSGVGSETDTD